MSSLYNMLYASKVTTKTKKGLKKKKKKTFNYVLAKVQWNGLNGRNGTKFKPMWNKRVIHID